MRSRPLTPVTGLRSTLIRARSRAFGDVYLGLAWSEAGLVGLTFPEVSKASVAAHLRKTWPTARIIDLPAAPAKVRSAAAKLGRYLAGETVSLDAIALDLSGAPGFHRRVYEAARAIPRGRTRSYGELASLLGTPGAARAIGQAMARNPIPIIVPCHRVLASGARIGGFSAPGGLESKQALLRMEGYREPGPLSFPRGVDAVAEVSARCPKLAAVIHEVGPFRPERALEGSPYEGLFRSILYQQLNGRAAATIFGRVKDRFGGEIPTPRRVLAAEEGTFRATGVSRNKWLSIRDLAQKTVDGAVPDLRSLRRMSDEEIIARLTPIRGVGRWTVEMLLIFRLKRPDVWPVDDYAVRAALGRLYGMKETPKVGDVRGLGDKWRPFRSVASWYLWRSLELDARA